MSGTLYIISTPIGNLGDISKRVKESLAASDLVFAEDTRVTAKLLHHLGLKKQMLSCHDFNEARRQATLEEINNLGQTVSLVSDAGTPLVSDPGFLIVAKAIELGMQVVPIPGPSAALAALVSSGLPCDRFAFEGFLPDKKGERANRLQKLSTDDRTLIFYAATNNVLAIVQELHLALGDRKACVGRELTKLHEEFVRGPLSFLEQQLAKKDPRGEYVIVVAGFEGESMAVSREEAAARLQDLLDSGVRLKDASSILARETGFSASELYKIGLGLKNDSSHEIISDA